MPPRSVAFHGRAASVGAGSRCPMNVARPDTPVWAYTRVDSQLDKGMVYLALNRKKEAPSIHDYGEDFTEVSVVRQVPDRSTGREFLGVGRQSGSAATGV